MSKEMKRKKMMPVIGWAIICPYTNKPQEWGSGGEKDRFEIYPKKADAIYHLKQWIQNDCEGYRIVKVRTVELIK